MIIYSGSVMACEFLVLNGAKINAIDADGNTALHLAALYGSTGQVMIKPYFTPANHKWSQCPKIHILLSGLPSIEAPCKPPYTKHRRQKGPRHSSTELRRRYSNTFEV